MTGPAAFSDPSGTAFIDTLSDPGAWADAIAHTPHLACQCAGEPDFLETYERPATGDDRSHLND